MTPPTYAAAIVAASIIATNAPAQQCGTTPEYQIIDLGDAPEVICNEGEGQQTRILAHGMNNRGDVVGQVICVTDDPQVDSSRAFVWLGERRFGLDAHEIIFLPHSDGEIDHSGAFEINDAGIVVGFEGDAPIPSLKSTIAGTAGRPILRASLPLDLERRQPG